MILALAQTRPLPGDIPGNTEDHLRFIENAAAAEADIILFPELSITGYEPKLAGDLAKPLTDPLWARFKERSHSLNIIIAVGMPLLTESGVVIGMGIFQPGTLPLAYGKKYLHPDEEPFFVPGPNPLPLRINGMLLSPAICYELSIPEHREAAVEAGAELYVASVAKVEKGTVAAHHTLAEMAATTGLTTAMVNCVGPAATGITVGQSAVWDKDGLVASLNETETGLLLYNTHTRKAEKVGV